MAAPSTYEYTRDYNPYAGDYSTYGFRPEHLFVGDVRRTEQLPPPPPKPPPKPGTEPYFEDSNSWEGGESDYWDSSWGEQWGDSTPSAQEDHWSFLPGRGGGYPMPSSPDGPWSFLPGKGGGGPTMPSSPDGPWSFLPKRDAGDPAMEAARRQGGVTRDHGGSLEYAAQGWPPEKKSPGMLDKFGSFIPGYDSVKAIEKGNYGRAAWEGVKDVAGFAFPPLGIGMWLGEKLFGGAFNGDNTAPAAYTPDDYGGALEYAAQGGGVDNAAPATWSPPTPQGNMPVDHGNTFEYAAQEWGGGNEDGGGDSGGDYGDYDPGADYAQDSGDYF